MNLHWTAYAANSQSPFLQQFLCIFLSITRVVLQYKNRFMTRYLLELRLLKQSPLSQRISSNVPIELCCAMFPTPSYTAVTCFETLISTRRQFFASTLLPSSKSPNAKSKLVGCTDRGSDTMNAPHTWSAAESPINPPTPCAQGHGPIMVSRVPSHSCHFILHECTDCNPLAVTVTRASYSNSGWKYTFATALVGKKKPAAPMWNTFCPISSRALHSMRYYCKEAVQWCWPDGFHFTPQQNTLS